MVISSDEAINERIVEMKKEKYGIGRIHNWLIGWDNFKQLDEIVVLCHICRVLFDNNVEMKNKEVENCFNKYYKQKLHGSAKYYLSEIKREFKLLSGMKYVKKANFSSDEKKNKPFSEDIKSKAKPITKFDLIKHQEGLK